MEIIGTLIIGLVVGLIARLLMPGRDPAGMIVTILLGIGGALVAYYVGRGLGVYGVGDKTGWIASILGAMLLLFVYRMTTNRHA